MLFGPEKELLLAPQDWDTLIIEPNDLSYLMELVSLKKDILDHLLKLPFRKMNHLLCLYVSNDTSLTSLSIHLGKLENSFWPVSNFDFSTLKPQIQASVARIVSYKMTPVGHVYFNSF